MKWDSKAGGTTNREHRLNLFSDGGEIRRLLRPLTSRRLHGGTEIGALVSLFEQSRVRLPPLVLEVV